jgi:diguanylate cyclase (GGDEF)-like protein
MPFMADDGANDEERSVSLSEAEALLGEIERLRARIATLEATIGELGELAYRDPLVGLANRRSFVEKLENLIARVERYGGPAAMMFVDADGLKQINDAFGHGAGDAALVEIARMLEATARKSDCVARLGGDEFAILLEQADELRAWQMGLRLVERIMASHFCVNGRWLRLSVAVGVGAIEPGDTPESVMARADRAMYRIKAA